MCRNASRASDARCASVVPPASTAATISSYRSGETTTATFAWFFADARTMAGPPMSICSTAASGSAPGRDRLGERVEVHDDELEGLDAELGELALVVFEPQVGEQARVHAGVQRAHAPVEVLGVAR